MISNASALGFGEIPVKAKTDDVTVPTGKSTWKKFIEAAGGE